MPDEAKKKPDAAAAPAATDKKDAAKGEKAKASSGIFTKTPVLLGGVMVLEAVVLLGGFKLMNRGPNVAAGATISAHGEGHGGEGDKAADEKKAAEIPVVEFRAPNKQSGRTFLYDVSIFVVVKQ